MAVFEPRSNPGHLTLTGVPGQVFSKTALLNPGQPRSTPVYTPVTTGVPNPGHVAPYAPRSGARAADRGWFGVEPGLADLTGVRTGIESSSPVKCAGTTDRETDRRSAARRQEGPDTPLMKGRPAPPTPGRLLEAPVRFSESQWISALTSDVSRDMTGVPVTGVAGTGLRRAG